MDGVKDRSVFVAMMGGVLDAKNDVKGIVKQLRWWKRRCDDLVNTVVELVEDANVVWRQ